MVDGRNLFRNRKFSEVYCGKCGETHLVSIYCYDFMCPCISATDHDYFDTTTISGLGLPYRENTVYRVPNWQVY